MTPLSNHVNNLMSPKMKHLSPLALIGILMLATFWIGLRQHPSSFDDAYITYRYAQNIASLGEFSYNPGEWVLGTTTPLYAIILAVGSFLWSDIPQLSHFVSVVSWVITIPILYAISMQETSQHWSIGILAAAIYALNVLNLRALGMETMLYVLVSLSSIYLFLRGSIGWAFVVGGLAFLMRWDGIVVTAVLFFVSLIRRDWKAIRLGIFISILIIGSWLVYSFITFGTIFPNSFFAKVEQGQSSGLGGGDITFLRGILIHATAAYQKSNLFLMQLPLLILGVLKLIKQLPTWWPVLLWTQGYFSGFVLLGVLRFDWYYPPLIPALALLIAYGASYCTSLISQAIKNEQRLPLVQTALYTLFLAIIILPNLSWLLQSRKETLSPRTQSYYEVGQWLNHNTPNDSSVAMIEIGVIGFYSQRLVVDTMGLVSPAMIGHLEEWLQTLQFALNYYWPDYVVGLEQTAWVGIVTEPWFKEAYTLVHTVDNADDPIAPIKIYRRNAQFPIQTYENRNQINAEFADAIRLHNLDVAADNVQPGDTLHLRLLWESLLNVEEDLRINLELINVMTGERHMMARNLIPLRGGNPTYLWQAGDVVTDYHTVLLPEDLPDGPYLVQVDVTQNGQVVTGMNEATPTTAVSSVITIGTVAQALPPPNLSQTTFAQGIQLEGYAFTSEANQLSFQFYWQTSEPVEENLTLFVHLIDQAGNLISQVDQPPQLPTSIWPPNQTIQSWHRLPVPDTIPPGEYRVELGFYSWPSLERLPILNSVCVLSNTQSLAIGQLSNQTNKQTFIPACHIR